MPSPNESAACALESLWLNPDRPPAAVAETARLGLEGERTAAFAFADALLALEELDRKDIADRLRARWPEVATKGDT